MRYIVCVLVAIILNLSEFAVCPPPPEFEYIGLTSTRAYYVSDPTNSPRDFQEAKFDCLDYGYTLATIDTEALTLIDDYLKFTLGKNITSDPFRTSAFLYPDYTHNAVWTTSGEIIGPQIPLYFQGPVPGEPCIGVWLLCPLLRRSCEPKPPCDNQECCTWATRLIHNVYLSNCLTKNRVLCEKKRDDILL